VFLARLVENKRSKTLKKTLSSYYSFHEKFYYSKHRYQKTRTRCSHFVIPELVLTFLVKSTALKVLLGILPIGRYQ